jgi:hypothetical protein
MRPITPGLTLAGIAALLLVACGGGGGGGGGSSSSSGGGTNTAPVANAGANQTVNSGVTVTLNGTASSDADGTVASYAWTQIAGAPTVVLTNGTTSQPTFPAPSVLAAATLAFSLVVTDNLGAASTISTVNVTVNPPVVGNVNLTGRVTFARVPFSTLGDRGLDYANPVQQPARGVIVRAIDANTLTVLATGTTTALGDYALTVAGNLNITIQAEARLLRDSAQPLPRWDVSVRDGVGSTAYLYTEPGSFNSSVGGAHNVAIPTGISAAGVATGTRASGPFAALDTVYQGIQTILGVAPAANFDALVIDWGTQANGTFFESGPVQRIALLSNLAMDTDEFDQHVVAHEFGHYIEFNFSRADNIGGSHSLGDKLDPRVAFGEGFGYAFAAIVLNDTDSRDSATDNGNPYSTGFNIETNPQTIPSGGCWCSESSVFSILWDLYDNAADTNDNVALGFQPIWNVLVGAQRTTPAFTTIFPFITALKTARPGDATAINTLVAAQNIDAATIDAYATTETHVPPVVPNIAALPLYTAATVGGPAVVLRTVDDANTFGLVRYNKLGNHRFIRFTVATARSLTITASSSNPNDPDTDFLVYRNGEFETAATGPPAPAETLTFSAPAGEYLIDVYDCANGCSTDQGTPGDYNLTVTIN